MKIKQKSIKILVAAACLVTLPALQAMPPMSGQPAYPGMTTGYAANGVYVVMAAPQGSNMILGGSVVATREVTLTAQLPGRVEFLGGREGDWFDDKQLIIGLSDDGLAAERRRALAQLGSAESMLRNSRVQYSRELWAPRSRDIGRTPGMGLPSMFDQFFTRGMGSNFGMGNPWLERQADLYGEGSRIHEAQSQMLQAHSGIDAVEAKLRDARTVAPFAGVITEKFVEVGDTVQPGEPLISFADVSRLQIQIEVPVRIVGALQIGMSVPARLDVGGPVEVQVAQIYPAAHANRHTVSVKLDLPEGTPAGPGLYAEVMLPDGDSRGQLMPVIPEYSAVRRGSLPAVFVIGQDRKTQLRLVRLGEPMGNGFVPVLSGLQPGEHILAAPRPGHRAGQDAFSNGGLPR
ncbi:efflux RND transporter periplasmic adaptor subunit [Sulfuriflexus mobilis]|uniref:efflux RND transporter periplasmic adaptor subunit n=1 Tax=Sulfuriflexus mobilis TaxID=1811807 RepID=UPI001E2CF829|nr:efflux RND transporter periplasmic adaptor subunit [Sulfuriflexus mobilis]